MKNLEAFLDINVSSICYILGKKENFVNLGNIMDGVNVVID